MEHIHSGVHMYRLRRRGVEQVPQGRRGVERYRQTWMCAAERIPEIRWAAMPRPTHTSATGFDLQDDDAA